MLVIFIGFAYGFGLLLARLGLPPMVGFLLAGFAANLAGLAPPEGLSDVADLGVTLLLFSIGLKLDLRSLLRAEIWLGTLVQMTLASVLMAGVLALGGLLWPSSLLDLDTAALATLGFALAFSSTVFAVKVLESKGHFSSVYGSIAIGILIMQDLLAVLYLSTATGAAPGPEALAVLALPLLRPILFKLMDYSGHGELFLLCGLFMALGVGAAGFSLVGLKPDLGALAVGALLAGHPRSSELAKSLFGFKELMLVGFFLSIGLGGPPSIEMLLVAAGLCVVLPLKSLIIFGLVEAFGFRARTGLFTALTLSNYSEFGLIVSAIAARTGMIGPEWPLVMALALSLSFTLASPLAGLDERLYQRYGALLRRFQRRRLHALDAPIPMGQVRAVVFGMGRIGLGAYDELAREMDGLVLGVDHDPARVEELRAAGRDVILGDAMDTEFWVKLEFQPDLELVILAMPWHHGNLRTAELLESLGLTCGVTAIARHPDEVDELKSMGVCSAFNMYEQAGAGLAATAMDSMRDGECIRDDIGHVLCEDDEKKPAP